MWRNADGSSGARVKALHGLFPAPYVPGACPQRILRLFGVLGKLVAR